MARQKRMSRDQIARLKVGDRIKVNTWHGRVGRRTMIRKVTQKHPELGVAIHAFGWSDFWLKRGEIIEKVKEVKE
jgi:hypothetical protein